MNEENKQEYLSIVFDLKPPKGTTHSIVNTIVLLLREICDMEDWQQWEEIDTLVLNNKIEQMKRELDNLKIIKFEEDNKC